MEHLSPGYAPEVPLALRDQTLIEVAGTGT
jgi:hypothetical protein